MITAPYNFVPLSDKVFFPDWADKISHDIPFEDGVSGTIDIKLTAQTPIFVRNGHTQENEVQKDSTYKSFSKTIDNRFFIPSTTLKGCIRSVMEILSYSKLTQVENASFGFRELQKPEYRNLMKNNHCGWLYFDNDSNSYKIKDCGKPERVSIKEIDALLQTNELYNFITNNDFKDDSDRLAITKYKKIYSLVTKKQIKSKEDYNKFIESDEYLLKSSKGGTYILSGQSSRRYYDKNAKKPKVGKDGIKVGCWKGKEKEFIFREPTQILPVSKETFTAFETIHKSSVDYSDFWKLRLKKNKEIPVFFSLRNNQVECIGLSYLFKYPFLKTVFDAIPDEHKNENKLDISECIFGTIKGNNSLKGRVLIGHAFALGQTTPLTEKSFVSGTPHASFYPNYVENGNNWNRAEKIAGRKRYPVRNNIINNGQENNRNMEQVCSMLKSGVQFVTTIYFHNLKEVELGALLSAVTFHGNIDKCYHNLGFGKALGYGKIRISDLKFSYVDNTDKNDKTPEYFLGVFEDTMNKFITNKEISDRSIKENNWLNSEQIKELIAMSIGIPQNMLSKFNYMKMSLDSGANEFLTAKKNNEHLERFSKITKVDGSIETVKGKEIYKKEKEKNEMPVEVIIPTNFKEEEMVDAMCIKPKVIQINGYNYDIQMVVPKTVDAKLLVNKQVKVRIKQISKAGKICQVEYIA